MSNSYEKIRDEFVGAMQGMAVDMQAVSGPCDRSAALFAVAGILRASATLPELGRAAISTHINPHKNPHTAALREVALQQCSCTLLNVFSFISALHSPQAKDMIGQLSAAVIMQQAVGQASGAAATTELLKRAGKLANS